MLSILSVLGLLAGTLLIYLGFQITDEIVSLVTRTIGGLILLSLFLCGSLLIKLGMVAAVLVGWQYTCARLSVFFARQLQK